MQERRRPADESVKRPRLAQLSMDEKVLRESNKYRDIRMAAKAAFETASFAVMAALPAVALIFLLDPNQPIGIMRYMSFLTYSGFQAKLDASVLTTYMYELLDTWIKGG